MIRVDPKGTKTSHFHSYMLAAVAPRPIAFASTMSADGTPNLAPYSFFNAFSSKPPTLMFSSNRRVRDNSTKDTLANIEATGEVVINVVTFPIVRQMALSSIEYPSDISEFEKAGFTAIPSETVAPFRVKESPVHFECKVLDIIRLGDQGGAGNLFQCEVQLMHIDSSILTDDGSQIDFNKIDLVGRMGGANYVRASGDAVFPLVQPVMNISIGMDNLPEHIRNSTVLTGNDLAQLASVTELPLKEPNFHDGQLALLESTSAIHQYVGELIRKGDIDKAWQVLLR